MKNQQKIQITLYRNLDFCCVALQQIKRRSNFPR